MSFPITPMYVAPSTITSNLSTMSFLKRSSLSSSDSSIERRPSTHTPSFLHRKSTASSSSDGSLNSAPSHQDGSVHRSSRKLGRRIKKIFSHLGSSTGSTTFTVGGSGSGSGTESSLFCDEEKLSRGRDEIIKRRKSPAGSGWVSLDSDGQGERDKQLDAQDMVDVYERRRAQRVYEEAHWTTAWAIII